MADGSVEVKITGSVDPSLAASATEAKTQVTSIGDAATISSAKMAAALQAAGGDLKKITPEMLGLAAATKSSAAASAEDAAAKTVDTAATAANTAATTANTGAQINSRAAYESLVLVHEALSGRFTRMAGSSMILTQQLAGQSGVASALAFATSGVGLAVLGTVAVLGAATVATIQYEESQKRLIETAIGLGAQSGLTSDQLDRAARAGQDWGSQSISQSREAAEAFAAAGIKSEASISALSNSVETYAQLTGEKWPEALKKAAEAMKDPVQGAKDLHEQLGILDGDQMEQIRQLTAQGDKTGAVNILMKTYLDRINDAHTAGVGFAGGLHRIGNALSEVWDWLGRVNDRLNEYNVLTNAGGSQAYALAQQQHAVALGIERRVQAQAHLNELSGKGLDAYNETPEGQAEHRKAELQGQLDNAQKALQADMQLHGSHSAEVARDREAIADYTHAVSTYLTAVQRKTQTDALDVKIAEAKHAHNQQLVRDLTEQKALLQEAGKVESDADARALARGAGDVAGARVHQPKGPKGPSVVSEWTEALHAAEIASNDFFSDQTEAELKFWKSKLGLTKEGSKDWLAVQSKIYEAKKTLEHRDYDEHIAALNDQLQVDRDNWSKEKGDWETKLQYIKDNYTAESTEYKNAYREFLAAEREHQDQVLRTQLEGGQRQLAALRTRLQAEQQIRQQDASATEAVIKAQSEGQILGEVSAAVRIGQIRRQAAEQEIGDAQTVYEALVVSNAMRLVMMQAAGRGETEEFKKEKAAQVEAEQAAQVRIGQLQSKASAQSIADILAVRTAYHSYIDGLVSSTTSAFTGILSRTQTWQQAMSSVFNSLLGTIDQVLSRLLSNWIATHLLMTSSERAQLAAQQAQHAAAETAKTAATVAGATARTTAEETAAATASATGAAERVAEVTGAAAVAAANAFAATAAIPIIGPALAPAAALAADAAVMAFVPQASLATGTNYLPQDLVVRAHEGERIIPKADNRKLMEMLQIGVQAGGSGSDTHIHLGGITVNGKPTQEDMRALKKNVVQVLREAHREGALTSRR